MTKTLIEALGATNYVKVLLDYALAQSIDKVEYTNFFTVQETPGPIVKTLYGIPKPVEVGTEIGQFGEPIIREREEMGNGFVEVGYFADEFQTDEARLELLNRILKKSNGNITDENITELETFLTGDMGDLRNLALAPRLAVDFMMAGLFSDGIMKSKTQAGISTSQDMGTKLITATTDDAVDYAVYLLKVYESLDVKPTAAIINGKTFREKILGSPTMQSYKRTRANYQIDSGAFTQANILSDLFADAGYSVEFYTQNQTLNLGKEGTTKTQKDNIVTFLPSKNVGTVEMYKDVKWSIRPAGKTYVETEGGLILNTVEIASNSAIKTGYRSNFVLNPTMPQNIVRVNIAAEKA